MFVKIELDSFISADIVQSKRINPPCSSATLGIMPSLLSYSTPNQIQRLTKPVMSSSSRPFLSRSFQSESYILVRHPVVFAYTKLLSKSTQRLRSTSPADGTRRVVSSYWYSTVEPWRAVSAVATQPIEGSAVWPC